MDASVCDCIGSGSMTGGSKDDIPTLEKALVWLAGCCDGAQSTDGLGFNKFDAEFGKKMAEKVTNGEQLSDYEYKNVHKMLEKYNKQLVPAGFDIRLIPNKQPSKTRPGGNEATKIPRLEVIIANEILKNNTVRTVKESKTILRKMENAGWSEFPELEIGVLAQEIGGRDATNNVIVNEVIGKIQRENLISMDDFERCPELLMDANGNVFNVLTRQFEDISDRNDVTIVHKIGTVFDPEAPIPEDFLTSVELSFPDRIERLCLQEHVGSGFYRVMKFDKMLVILGETRNGKTTFMEIIEAVAGSENISSIPLQELTMRFKSYNLWRKLFNVGDDLSSASMKDAGTIKVLTGGAKTNIERKFGQQFDAQIYAKGIYGCNLLPAAPNKDDSGYYTKFLLISAPNTFLLPNEIGVDGLGEGQYLADPDLVDKLTEDPKMLSGILNWCLEGLERLEKQRGYSMQITNEENQVKYDTMSEPSGDLSTFIRQICDQVVGCTERKADLQALYNLYSRSRKIPLSSTTSFNKHLNKIGINPKYRVENYKIDPKIDMNDAKNKKPFILKDISLKVGWEKTKEFWETAIKISEEMAKDTRSMHNEN